MIAAMFPGQGSLKPSMGEPWLTHRSSAVVQEISDISGRNVMELLTEAPIELLVRTDNAQLATFALSMMTAHAASHAGLVTGIAIGHSLGEYSALCHAGILSLEDATRLVLARGHAMREASTMNPGTMAAVMGADPTDVAAALTGYPGLVIANLNAPGQVVVAGPLDSIDALRGDAKALGLRRVLPLDVGGAFHSPLMEPAREVLVEALEATTFHLGTIPVVANVDGAPHNGGAQWRELLADQLTGSVLFSQSIDQLPLEVRSGVELGAGGVLCGMVKRIRPDMILRSVDGPADLEGLEVLGD